MTVNVSDVILYVLHEMRQKRGDNVNANKLRGKIVEKGISVGKVADLIGMNRSSLYRKLNDSEKLTIGEAIKLKNVLELSNYEAFEIFLD